MNPWGQSSASFLHQDAFQTSSRLLYKPQHHMPGASRGMEVDSYKFGHVPNIPEVASGYPPPPLFDPSPASSVPSSFQQGSPSFSSWVPANEGSWSESSRPSQADWNSPQPPYSGFSPQPPRSEFIPEPPRTEFYPPPLPPLPPEDNYPPLPLEISNEAPRPPLPPEEDFYYPVAEAPPPLPDWDYRSESKKGGDRQWPSQTPVEQGNGPSQEGSWQGGNLGGGVIQQTPWPPAEPGPWQASQSSSSWGSTRGNPEGVSASGALQQGLAETTFSKHNQNNQWHQSFQDQNKPWNQLLQEERGGEELQQKRILDHGPQQRGIYPPLQSDEAGLHVEPRPRSPHISEQPYERGLYRPPVAAAAPSEHQLIQLGGRRGVEHQQPYEADVRPSLFGGKGAYELAPSARDFSEERMASWPNSMGESSQLRGEPPVGLMKRERAWEPPMGAVKKERLWDSGTGSMGEPPAGGGACAPQGGHFEASGHLASNSNSWQTQKGLESPSVSHRNNAMSFSVVEPRMGEVGGGMESQPSSTPSSSLGLAPPVRSWEPQQNGGPRASGSNDGHPGEADDYFSDLMRQHQELEPPRPQLVHQPLSQRQTHQPGVTSAMTTSQAIQREIPQQHPGDLSILGHQQQQPQSSHNVLQPRPPHPTHGPASNSHPGFLQFPVRPPQPPAPPRSLAPVNAVTNVGHNYFHRLPLQPPEPVKLVDACSIFFKPGRDVRPERFVVILRGLPGSGKTHLVKTLRDVEVMNGGSVPRIHSIDDYFMAEVEKEDDDPANKAKGKRKVMKKVMEYVYEAEMEDAYRVSMLKSFKKTLDDGGFSFVIVDARNVLVAHFAEFWALAKRSGYEVYILEAPQLPPAECHAQNQHRFALAEIERMARLWENTPALYNILDVSSLLKADKMSSSGGIREVEMDMEEQEQEQGLAADGGDGHGRNGRSPTAAGGEDDDDEEDDDDDDDDNGDAGRRGVSAQGTVMSDRWSRDDEGLDGQEGEDDDNGLPSPGPSSRRRRPTALLSPGKGIMVSRGTGPGQSEAGDVDDLDDSDDEGEGAGANANALGALSGLMSAYVSDRKERSKQKQKKKKQLRWADLEGEKEKEKGFRIGGTPEKKRRLVIGPGHGYNEEQNPAVNDDDCSANGALGKMLETEGCKVVASQLRAEGDVLRAAMAAQRRQVLDISGN